jgi:hypothetical protein
VNTKLIERAKEIMRDWFPEYADQPRTCLYRALSLYKAGKEMGIKAVIQAGTAFWPRMPRALALALESVGVPTLYQFGYKWEPDHPDSLIAMLMSNLPEMHVWNYLSKEKVVVDMAAGTFPDNCLLMAKQDWPGKKPPEIFWHPVEKDLPEGVWYNAVEEAMEVACYFSKRTLHERGFDDFFSRTHPTASQKDSARRHHARILAKERGTPLDG